MRNTAKTRTLTGVVAGIAFIIIMVASTPSFGVDSRHTTSADAPVSDSVKKTEKTEKTVIDYTNPNGKTQKRRGDDAIYMLGGPTFHHNGAIIQCDSARFYEEQQKAECFGNVIISQDSTTIYGDWASYDGNTEIATVYSPLIKITSGEDMVMYTRQLTFNTRTQIGEFSGGGLVTQRDNTMQAQRGYFYALTNDIKLHQDVSLRNDQYQLRTDSLRFDLDTEVTTFLTSTYVWDQDRDFLFSKSGTYDRRTLTYTFNNNAYLMTENQELWADSMIYNSQTQEAFMRRNIQIFDSAHSSLAFGDKGYYNEVTELTILTLKPSVRTWQVDNSKKKNPADSTESYAPTNEPAKADTTFMRADTIYIEVVPKTVDKKPEPKPQTDSLSAPSPDSLVVVTDSLSIVSGLTTDSTATKIENAVKKTKAELKAERKIKRREQKEKHRAEKALKKREKAEKLKPQTLEKQPIVDTTNSGIGADKAANSAENSSEENTAAKNPDDAQGMGNATAETDTASHSGDAENAQSGDKTEASASSVTEESKQKRATATQSATANDATNFQSAASNNSRIGVADSTAFKGNGAMSGDSSNSTKSDSLLSAIGAQPEAKLTIDTTERLIRGFNTVRAFNKDYQLACDSMVTYSYDSTMSMFGSPVLWNENKQITSQQIDAFTKNGEIDYADFIGDPMMVEQVDTSHYNQVQSKTLRALFRNNEIEKAILRENVVNYYWWQDEETEIVEGFFVIYSSEMEVYFEERQAVGMFWVGPDTNLYPLDQIPSKQGTKLEGFQWITDIRPAGRYDICTRIERPSMRAIAEQYAKPTFQIEHSILKQKEELLKDGEWRDRWDAVTMTPDQVKQSKPAPPSRQDNPNLQFPNREATRPKETNQPK